MICILKYLKRQFIEFCVSSKGNRFHLKMDLLIRIIEQNANALPKKLVIFTPLIQLLVICGAAQQASLSGTSIPFGCLLKSWIFHFQANCPQLTWEGSGGQYKSWGPCNHMGD